jgi:hypothetical protein
MCREKKGKGERSCNYHLSVFVKSAQNDSANPMNTDFNACNQLYEFLREQLTVFTLVTDQRSVPLAPQRLAVRLPNNGRKVSIH